MKFDGPPNSGLFICRHEPGDPDCSSNGGGAYYAGPTTPDKTKYEIIDVARAGTHLTLKVRYPNCARCAYEGVKVLVFLDVAEVDVLRWREIDPHFRPSEKQPETEAPSPAARFPATDQGWKDALAYMRTRVRLDPTKQDG